MGSSPASDLSPSRSTDNVPVSALIVDKKRKAFGNRSLERNQ